VDLPTFRRRAREMWDRIPPEFRAGVEALVVEESEVPHPELRGIWTLGECLTEEWPGTYAEGGSVRSRVHLYHGSFRRLAALDPAFSWEAELWETILHELLHHREFAASEEGLEVFDRAVDENFRRHAGKRFDPLFYRLLPPDADGAVRLDAEIFLEVEAAPGREEVRFEWRDRAYTVRVPSIEAILYVNPVNLAEGRLWVVVHRRTPWWRRLLELVGGSDGVEVLHASRRALPVPRRSPRMSRRRKEEE